MGRGSRLEGARLTGTRGSPGTWRLIVAIVLGTTLNPLNSSMVAVALVAIHRDFHVDLGTSTWVVAAFYMTGAVAQPLMGRIADLFGARRVFLTGISVAALVALLAPFSPSFGWLVAARCVQALATSTAFPAGLGLIRAASGQRVPSQSLAAMSVAASASAALGPTIGGLALTAWGWQGIFYVNVPLTVAGIVLGLLWLPAPPPSDPSGSALARLDLPGVALFAATVVPVLAGLLELGSSRSWILFAVAPVAAVLLAVRELRTSSPFFDLHLLARNPAIVGVFVQFAAVTFVFYSFFFGLPVWLEQVGGYDARAAGLIVLPLTGISVAITPLAATLITRSGARRALVIGSSFLVAGTLLMLTLGPHTPLVELLGITLVLGVPSGFNTLGLQALLYAVTPAERISWAGGQFQTFRYIGATLASAVLGAVFHQGSSTAGLHSIAAVLAFVSVVLLAASIFTRRSIATSIPG